MVTVIKEYEPPARDSCRCPVVSPGPRLLRPRLDVRQSTDSSSHAEA